MRYCPSCGGSYAGLQAYCPLDGTRLAERAGAADLVGRVIGERYRLTQKIGSGGFGSVFVAQHMRVPRKLAIKVLTPGVARDQAWVKRFEREMQATAILAHPHIVDIIDYGHDPDIGYYLVMEHLDGEDLRSRINREGPVPVLDMLAVMRQVADALDTAHEAGIVHRDVKSANVFLLDTRTRGPNLSVKLLDFGVAVVTRSYGGIRRLQVDEAEARQVVGSPATMSPEQIRGEDLDARSDLYSLGVVLFRMLTGTVPFSANSVEELWRLHLNQPAPPPSSFAAAAWAPGELDSLVRRMLAKRPDQRPGSANEVMQALERIADAVESAWAKHHVLTPPRQDSRRLRRLREVAHDTMRQSDTRAAAPSSWTEEAPRAPTPPPVPLAPGPMILAVDDEPAMRTFVKRLIHRKGYRCEAVESGAAAMTWLVENPEPDAIVLDYLMPGLAGVDLIRTLRTRGCNAPIIVWSGLDSDIISEQIKDQGVAAVLDKYDDVHRIGDVLAELLGEED